MEQYNASFTQLVSVIDENREKIVSLLNCERLSVIDRLTFIEKHREVRLKLLAALDQYSEIYDQYCEKTGAQNPYDHVKRPEPKLL